jgi:hypothetical protein
MRSFGGRPVVEVQINGKGPHPFILDTGAGGTILSQDLADELKLSVLGEGRVSSPGGKGLPSKTIRLDRVQMGGAAIVGLTAEAVNLERVFGAKGNPRGVLSTRHFDGFLVTLDYPQKQIIIRRGALPPADSAEIFAYDSRQRLPGIRILVAGREFDVDLDSGAPGGITLPTSAADKLPLAAAPVEVGRARTLDGEFPILRAKLKGKVQLGRYVVENPDLGFHDMPHSHGNIGFEILKRFAVTVDRENHRCRLEEQRPIENQSTQGPRRYGIRFLDLDKETLEVVSVDADSPAAKAGIRRGDLIIRLDDKPIKELSPSERLQVLRKSPLTLVIQRADKKLEVRMSLDPVGDR